MNKINIGGGAVVAVAGLLAVGGAAFFLRKKGGEVAGSVLGAVNPVSDKNLAYRGVNALGELRTGDKEWSLGGAIYDSTHAPYDPNSPAPYDSSFSLSGAYDSVYGGNLGYFAPFGLVAKGTEAAIDGFSDMDYSFLNKVNPASDKNIVYGGVNAVGAKVTGDKDWSLGSWLYEVTHDGK